jgi:hypothetical protein
MVIKMGWFTVVEQPRPLQTLLHGEDPWIREAPKHTNTTILVGSFGLDSILLTEGSMMNPHYEVWE